MELAQQFVWEPPIGEDEIAEIRRMKARIERERIPAGEDPAIPSEAREGIAVRRRVDRPDAPAPAPGRAAQGRWTPSPSSNGIGRSSGPDAGP